MSGRRQSGILLGLVCVAAVLSRLPLVYFSQMPLTGDECVVGLMGKHLAEGADLSLYFWGQHYGLSIIEASAAAAATPLFGVGAAAVRMGMLGLLLGSLICLYVGLSRIAGRGTAVLGTLLLLTIPPWTLWSVQARGGYVTALLGTCAVIAGVAICQHRPTRWGWGVVVIAASITLLAKSSWLPALLPILLLVPIQQRNVRLGFSLVTGTAALCLAGHLVGIHLTHDYWQQPALSLSHISPNLRQLPTLLRYHFTSDLFSSHSENPLYWVAGWIWLLGFPAGAGIQLWRLRSRRFCPWSHALCLSAVSSLVALLVVPLLPRYLLSISFILVVWLVVECAHFSHRRITASIAVLLITLGFVGLVHDRLGTIDTVTEGEIRRLVELLEEEGIHQVYSTDALLQWVVMFYSSESIRCRWTSADDRLPEIPAGVDRALHRGEPTAIIGMLGNLGGLGDPGAGIDVYSFPDLPFFIAPHPTPQVLQAQGFELHANPHPIRE